MNTLDDWATRWNLPPQAVAELAQCFNPPVHVAPGASEQHAQGAIRLAAARRGVRLWRNNSGAVTDDTGRLVRYGLGNDSDKINRVFKSSDLIGFTPMTVTAGDVGKPVAVFTAYEMKAPGWKGVRTDRERAQAAFLAVVAAAGGIAKFSTGDL